MLIVPHFFLEIKGTLQSLSKLLEVFQLQGYSTGLSNFNVILYVSFKEKLNQVNQAPLVAGTGIEDGDDELHLFGV